MSWNPTNKTLTDPISFDDVAQALGITGSVYTLGWMIANGAINPFAVNKPYRAPTLQTSPRLTTQFSMLGLQIPYATTVQSFIDYHGTGDLGSVTPANGWVYLRPRGKGGGSGGADEWFRIFDFLKMASVGTPDTGEIGYHGAAVNPFGRYFGPANTNVTGGNITAQQKLPIPPQTGRPDYDMVISDLNGLKYSDGSYMGGFPSASDRLLYYGMLLVPVGNGTTWDSSKAAKLVANTTAIDADSDSPTGKIQYRGFETLRVDYRLTTGFSAMRYRVYPFLTPKQLNTQQPIVTVDYSSRSTALPDSMKIIPIPGVTPTYVTFYSDNIEVNVYTSGSASAGIGDTFDVAVYIEIINHTANAITIPSDTDLYGVNLRLRDASNDYTAPSSSLAGSPSGDEKFFSTANRWDASHPSGTADTSYATMLGALAGTTIAAGATKRFPSGSLTYNVTFKGGQAIHVGFYLGSSFHSGNVVPRTPIVPD